MVLVLYFQKGRLCIILQISTISEHTADLTKEEEKVRECSEPSIVITFEPHTSSSDQDIVNFRNPMDEVLPVEKDFTESRTMLL